MEPNLNEAVKRILEAARRKLAADLPELMPAIYILRDEPVETPGPFLTDGKTLMYHPETVARDYLKNRQSIAEQLLHVIVHGLLGHYSKREGQIEVLFDAAADIKAADFISRLAPSYIHPRSLSREVRELLKGSGQCSLEQLYGLPRSSDQAGNMVMLSQELARDSHVLWSRPTKNQSGNLTPTEGIWIAAAQKVARQLMSGSRSGRGDLAGELSEVYRDTEDSGVSYKEFLQRFMRIEELAMVDPDSIDRIWYHTGLTLLGDVPILEPDELREDAETLELAVALDTSGSCQGEIMREFLGELLAILRDGGGPKMKLTLIQCDVKIQSITEITGEDDPAELLSDLKLLGWGGTDFRPVFRYLDACQEGKVEGKRFRGLLYLSDGMGAFPDKPPDYPTAFLFPREQRAWEEQFYNNIPDWVIQVGITEDNSLVIRENEH